MYFSCKCLRNVIIYGIAQYNRAFLGFYALLYFIGLTHPGTPTSLSATGKDAGVPRTLRKSYFIETMAFYR